MKELPEALCSRLAVQLVVTLVQFHYPRLRTLHQAVQRHVAALGDEAGRPEWARLTSSYRVLSRELLELMEREDAAVLDRAQILAARQQLTFGALASQRRELDTILDTYRALAAVRRRLDDALEATLPLHVESPAGAALRTAIKTFLTALQETRAFEQEALMPVLGPFLHTPG